MEEMEQLLRCRGRLWWIGRVSKPAVFKGFEGRASCESRQEALCVRCDKTSVMVCEQYRDNRDGGSETKVLEGVQREGR